jgi:hypothetical protein
MAEVRPVLPAVLIVAICSRHERALVWARDRLEQEYGPLALAGLPFPFVQTTFYEASMGPGLIKQLLAFENLIDPVRLADIKLRTNALERELTESEPWSEQRPLNLDPGYLVQGKFLLASMKDHAHRVYLRDGVYAEVTLTYRGGAFQPWPWTYADYQLPDVHAFLQAARAWYRERLLQRKEED